MQYPARLAPASWKLPSLVLLAFLAAAPLSAQAPLVVYADTAQSAGWENWSWATHQLNSTTHVFSGTTAIRFEPDAWEGIFFHSTTVLTPATHDRVRFRIHGGSAGGQLVTAALQLGGTNLGQLSLAGFLPGGNLPTSWVEVTVPLAQLGAPGSTAWDGFVLQAGTAGNQAPVWVDQIELLVNPNGPPVGGPVAIAIDASQNRRPIDPRIYGVNFGDAALHDDLQWPIRRWGGNSTTRYNWRIDVHNTAFDYFFQNIVAPDPGTLPHGSALDVFVDETFEGGGEPIVTVPLIGFTPREDGRIKRWAFSQAEYGQQSMDECRFYLPNPPNWCTADSGNGRCDGVANPDPIHCVNGTIIGNDPSDTSIAIGPSFVTQWMAHIASRVGTAAAGGVRYFALDNETMLWNSTHRDVFPTPLDYDGLWSRTVAVASAMKAQDSAVQILGPVSWGWCDLFTSAEDAASQPTCIDGPDRQNHGGLPLTAWYLDQVCDYQDEHGVRLVDYLDVHYYPQGGVDGLQDPGEDAATAAKRLRSLRELWDPTWVAESWIGDEVNLIPRLRGWIDEHCPGMGLAITEYSWGSDDGPTGALAQAEVLAIFGREGVDIATRWVAPEPGTRTVDAFRLFLDYDGDGSRIDGTSVSATSNAVADVAAYAVEDGGLLRVLLFNHDTVARVANVAVPGLGGPGTLYRFDAATPLGPAGSVATTATGFDLNLPARSATLAVFPLGLFADGFETGSTSRWSAHVP
jgi:hypothetical protein